MVTKELEMATIQIRVYPSDYKELFAEARKRRTSIAQILHVKLVAAKCWNEAE